jgi:glutathione S-transferase
MKTAPESAFIPETAMIKLRTSPGSPYGRKAALAVHHLGLVGRVEIVDSTQDADDRIRKLNPLNKIPLLVLEDDSLVFDSPVILEYLDMLAGGGKIIPPDPKARFRSLTLEALADGVIDACVLISYEARWHEPDAVSEKWLAHQQVKIDKGIDVIAGALPSGPVCVGQITLLCALDFLDKRNGGRWRDGRTELVAWREQFVASFAAYTKIPPIG